MGSFSSKFGRSVTRAVKNYDVENRAAKAIEEQQRVPRPAPKHKTTVDALKKDAQEHPEYAEELARKNDSLHSRLKGIHVEMIAKSSSEQGEKPDIQERPLPMNRATEEEGEYGFKEIGEIPAGRVSLKQAIDFISQHQLNPEQFTVQHIATTYKLKEADVQSILQHYNIFNVVAPKEVLDQNKKHLEQYNLAPVTIDEKFKLPELPRRSDQRLEKGMVTVNPKR